MLRGAVLDGAALADLIEALVAALNDQDMPTAGSMLEAFNQRLVMDCVDVHSAALGAVMLPSDVVRICRGRDERRRPSWANDIKEGSAYDISELPSSCINNDALK
jgi:hypothetical protein